MYSAFTAFFIVSFCLSVGLTFLFRRAALARQALVRKGIPCVGGISIGISFLIVSSFGFYLYNIPKLEIWGIIAASLVMLIFGIIDDWRELSVGKKFLFQSIAALLIISFGIRTNIVYIGIPLNVLVTLIWIIGITNAFNHLDIIDGLAGGVVLVTGLAFLAIVLFKFEVGLVILILALLGSITGFMFFNLPPAKVYMGNSGSHFVGFVLAVITIVISYAPIDKKIALLSPLLILGFPILDTFFLILIRTLNKKSVFKKSDDHLALRFMVMGNSKRKVLFILLRYTAFFSILGVALNRSSFIWEMIIMILALLAGLHLMFRMGRVKIDG